jgi:hypothetical protein
VVKLRFNRSKPEKGSFSKYFLTQLLALNNLLAMHTLLKPELQVYSKTNCTKFITTHL